MEKKKKETTSEIKEEVKTEKVKVEKVKKEKIKKPGFDIRIVAIIAAAVLVIIGVIALLSRTKVDTITKVKRVVDTKYYNVECLDTACDYIMAAKGNKLGKSTVYIFDANGKKIASYKDNFFTCYEQVNAKLIKQEEEKEIQEFEAEEKAQENNNTTNK